MDGKIKQAKQLHKHGREAELHGRFKGTYLLDLVFGASDGIITTFAVVAGVTGASLSATVVLILGFTNLLADGISMAIGNYLGRRSEEDYFIAQKEVEEWEVKHIPQMEKEEIRKIYSQKGFTGAALNKAVESTIKNKDQWVDLMLKEEHGIILDQDIGPIKHIKHGLATFIAFFSAGLIPLLTYIFPFGSENLFLTTSVLTGIALFGVGATRTVLTKKSWWLSGFEILGVGSIAAVVAYFVGAVLENII